MKRIILIIAIVTMVNLIYGQGLPFAFGPEIGWTSSKISSDLNENYSNFQASSKSGYLIGAFLRVGSKIYLEPELYFSSEGGKINYDVSTTSTQVSENITLNTVTIPVLLGDKIIKNKLFNVRVFIGPDARYIVNKDISISGVNTGITKSDFKNAIYGGQIGAGFDVLMFTFNVRYELDFNDISSSDILSNTKNNLWLFTLGWKIL